MFLHLNDSNAIHAEGRLRHRMLFHRQGGGNPKLAGGFKYLFMFTPIWGKFPFWLYNIFQVGWFNHQLVSIYVENWRVYLEPKWPLFLLEVRPCFGGLTCKNRGHWVPGLPERQFAFDKIKLVGTGYVFGFCFFEFKTLAGFLRCFLFNVFLFHIYIYIPCLVSQEVFLFSTWNVKSELSQVRAGRDMMLFFFRENLSSVKQNY